MSLNIFGSRHGPLIDSVFSYISRVMRNDRINNEIFTGMNVSLRILKQWPGSFFFLKKKRTPRKCVALVQGSHLEVFFAYTSVPPGRYCLFPFIFDAFNLILFE